MNGVRARREALGLTQQDAARRAGVSVATWRRLEAGEGPVSVRMSTLAAVERLLRVPHGGLEGLRSGKDFPLSDVTRTRDTAWIEKIGRSFDGDPLTPRQAFKMSMAVAGMEDDAYVQWDEYLAGQCSVDDLHLVSELPDWVLFIVNNVWLQRFRNVFVKIGERIVKGEVPYPRCMAERVALWITLRSTQARSDDIESDMIEGDDDVPAILAEYPELEDDWESVEEKLFDEDFDFQFIWLENFTRVIFGDSRGGFDENLGVNVNGFHPFRWWETTQPPVAG